MTPDQSALLEVLDALKAADLGDRVHGAAQTIYQALVEAELTAVIGGALRARRCSGGAAQRKPATHPDHHG
jgi:putative transposase